MKRSVLTLLLVVLCGAVTTLPNVASACPSCKESISQDEKQPKAYMYSILFMLGMPAVVFGAFGYGLYQMSRRESELESLPPLEEPN